VRLIPKLEALVSWFSKSPELAAPPTNPGWRPKIARSNNGRATGAFALRSLTWLGLPDFTAFKIRQTGLGGRCKPLRIRPNHLRFYAATERLPTSRRPRQATIPFPFMSRVDCTTITRPIKRFASSGVRF